MTLIGLSGPAGAGKDTVADYLVSKYSYKRYAFADAVREVALSIDPYVLVPETFNAISIPSLPPISRLSEAVEAFGWDHVKRNIPEARRLLQVIGTEAGRQVLGPNVWVKIVERKWDEDGLPDAVITDMRFENEDFWVINNEGITARIERPNNPDAIVANHASEQAKFDCEHTLINDGSLEDLYAKVDELLARAS